jgi:hypothetical protein
MHVSFIGKWSFWDGFLTTLGLFSFKRFSKWIPLVVSIFFHITQGHNPLWITHVLRVARFLTMTKPLWTLSHCDGGNIIFIHKPCFMFSIFRCFCNIFFFHTNLEFIWKVVCETIIDDIRCTVDLHLDYVIL